MAVPLFVSYFLRPCQCPTNTSLLSPPPPPPPPPISNICYPPASVSSGQYFDFDLGAAAAEWPESTSKYITLNAWGDRLPPLPPTECGHPPLPPSPRDLFTPKSGPTAATRHFDFQDGGREAPAAHPGRTHAPSAERLGHTTKVAGWHGPMEERPPWPCLPTAALHKEKLGRPNQDPTSFASNLVLTGRAECDFILWPLPKVIGHIFKGFLQSGYFQTNINLLFECLCSGEAPGRGRWASLGCSGRPDIVCPHTHSYTPPALPPSLFVPGSFLAPKGNCTNRG